MSLPLCFFFFFISSSCVIKQTTVFYWIFLFSFLNPCFCPINRICTYAKFFNNPTYISVFDEKLSAALIDYHHYHPHHPSSLFLIPLLCARWAVIKASLYIVAYHTSMILAIAWWWPCDRTYCIQIGCFQSYHKTTARSFPTRSIPQSRSSWAIYYMECAYVRDGCYATTCSPIIPLFYLHRAGSGSALQK